MNKLIIKGRLVRDPELRSTPTGANVCTFSIAVDRGYVRQGEERQTDFINIVTFGSRAEFVSRYFKKGSSIIVCGSIQTRDWTDSNGQKRYATEVVADEAMFVDSKNEGGAGQTYTPDAYATPSFSSPMGADTPRFEELKSDDDLPF